MTPAVRGDYFVTPDHLRGERSLEFIGRDPAYQVTVEVDDAEFAFDPSD